jgi:uncharacterized delta-60 repeat protein
MAIQSDGKIVAAGRSDNGGDDDFAIVRYNTNGSLDNTFGTNGIVTTTVGASDAGAFSVVIQSDGNILAAGYCDTGSDNDDFTIIRYNPNGSLDNTFGTNGIVITYLGGSGDVARSLATQSDGKIVAAGFSSNGSNVDFVIVRYNSNGSLDNTFGTSGIVVTPIGPSDDVANSIAIQSDGKITAAGYSDDGSDDYDFAIVRYNSNGSLDNTFGTNGIVTTSVGVSTAYANSIAIQSDGKIVAAGYSDNGSDDDDFTIIRYNPNGSLDNTFGTNGIVTTPVGASGDFAYSIAIQSDGKILAAGYFYNGSNYDFAIVRYNPNGSLDNTFGTNGIVTTSIGADYDYSYSVAIQSDGKILAAGYSYNGSDYDFAIVRYNSNGSLDYTFGTYGIITTPVGALSDYARSIAIQSDGKIAAAGYYYNGSDYDFAIVRYNSDGSLDNTFGTNGIVTTPVGPSDDAAHSIAIQSDGKIAAAGYYYNGSDYDFVIVRYNSNGSLDNTFGSNGIVTTLVGASNDVASSLAIQSNGKIAASGYSYSGSDYDFAVVGYNTNGSLDNSFGTNGIVTTQIGSSGNLAFASAIQDDGKIVIAGMSENSSSYSVFTLVRYFGDGSTEVDNENNEEIPAEFSLEQNYPNPFNPTTNFEYRISNFGFVSLKVFDVLGNEVATLVNEEKPAGAYQITFNAYGLSSGVYFYKLQAGSFVKTKKMILLK